MDVAVETDGADGQQRAQTAGQANGPDSVAEERTVDEPLMTFDDACERGGYKASD